MNPRDEELFFGHDLATPLSNIVGAHYLLKASLDPGDAAASEALDILAANARTLERMLGWYWRLRELEGSIGQVTPWPAEGLPALLDERIAEAGLPLRAPERAPGDGRLRIPAEPLCTGLIGAALTLQAASEAPVEWRFEGTSGLLVSRYEVAGDGDLLDPERLFRRVYWPARRGSRAWLDPCLPYLRAVLVPFGGTLELVWERGRWALAASLPLVP